MTENLHNHFTSQFVGLHSAAVKSTTLNQSQVAGGNLNLVFLGISVLNTWQGISGSNFDLCRQVVYV